MHRRLELQLLIAILVIASLLGAASLSRGHNWGDDFAGYLMQAQSLVDGNTHEFIQSNAFTIEHSPGLGPVAYPWGYPILLAPVLAVFGLRVMALKLINTIFYGLFLIVFYRLARLRFSSVWALALVAIFAFNPALLQAQDVILSDIPFLFTSTLTLFLIERHWGPGRAAPSLTACIAIGVAVAAAFALRVLGLFLLAALAATQWQRFGRASEIRANLLLIITPYVAFGLLTALLAVLLPNGPETYFENYLRLTPEVLLANLNGYPEVPGDMFRDVALHSLFAILLELLFLIGLFALPIRNAPLAAYIFPFLGVLISWPVWGGLRLVFPILPPIILVAAEGGRSALEFIAARTRPPAGRALGGLAATLIILSLVVSTGRAWANLHNGRQIIGPFDPVSAQMFEFVRENTPPDSVIVFFKPRALRLLTGRIGFRSYTCESMRKGDYLVFQKGPGGAGQVEAPEACTNVHLLQLFDNRRFTVYQINPQ